MRELNTCSVALLAVISSGFGAPQLPTNELHREFEYSKQPEESQRHHRDLYSRSNISGAGDLTGDGIPDFFLSAPRYSELLANRGMVELRDGANGSSIWQRRGEAVGSRLGEASATIGDVDGDEATDLVASRRFGVGVALVVYSGRTGLIYRELSGPSAICSGVALAGIGDVDADGTPDLAARFLHPRRGASLTRKGLLVVYSGATALELYRVDADLAFSVRFEQYHFGSGSSVASIADLNGDEIPDLIVGGFLKALDTGILSGKDGSLIKSIPGVPSDFIGGGAHGWAVASMSDLDGDGLEEVVAGCPDPRVVVYSSGTGEVLYSIYDRWASSIGFGDTVARLADLDGDLIDDLAVGSFTSGRYVGPYHCDVVSGRTGTLLIELSSRDPIVSEDEEYWETNSFAFVASSGLYTDQVESFESLDGIVGWVYFPQKHEVSGFSKFGKELKRIKLR